VAYARAPDCLRRYTEGAPSFASFAKGGTTDLDAAVVFASELSPAATLRLSV
jgi:hypothetical protein